MGDQGVGNEGEGRERWQKGKEKTERVLQLTLADAACDPCPETVIQLSDSTASVSPLAPMSLLNMTLPGLQA